MGMGNVCFRIKVRFAHGIGGIKSFGGIICIPAVIRKVGLIHQEILIFGHTSIPCGIQVVVQIVQASDVPSVGTACISGNEPCIHAQCQSQTVEQAGVALAYGSAVNQSGIGGVFQCVVLVIQIFIIIGDVFAEVIVDGLDFPVVGFLRHIQISQKGIHSLIHFLLLSCGGVVVQRVGDGGVVAAISGGGAPADPPIGPVPHQIVALHGNTRMLQSQIESGFTGGVDGGLGILPVGNGLEEIDGKGLGTIFHMPPDVICNFRNTAKVG